MYDLKQSEQDWPNLKNTQKHLIIIPQSQFIGKSQRD